MHSYFWRHKHSRLRQNWKRLRGLGSILGSSWGTVAIISFETTQARGSMYTCTVWWLGAAVESLTAHMHIDTNPLACSFSACTRLSEPPTTICGCCHQQRCSLEILGLMSSSYMWETEMFSEVMAIAGRMSWSKGPTKCMSFPLLCSSIKCEAFLYELKQLGPYLSIYLYGRLHLRALLVVSLTLYTPKFGWPGTNLWWTWMIGLYIPNVIYLSCTSQLMMLQSHVAHSHSAQSMIFGYAPQVFGFYAAHVNLRLTKTDI